jgi:serine/threonine-protein kinase HipA
MKLVVFVLGQAVGTLEGVGDFKSVFSYLPDTPEDRFVSLTMPVRTESYAWDDSLHPIFQMNLPEGYLLQVLQEDLGPHIGANPTALLAVTGRNMVGRVQVAAPGASLAIPAQPVEVAEILEGDNGYEAFANLVRRHAHSGVSGVVPKFLGTGIHAAEGTVSLSAQNKTTVLTHRHIIKGSSSALPFVALNEHFCMQVAAQLLPTARTAVSKDGRALVVDRFDVNDAGQAFRGLEDFCALLGMRPAAKYETTWERIAKAARHHVPPAGLRAALHHLGVTLLLTYALRNADCHAKNVALLYTRRADVAMAPVYDMVTTTVYDGYELNPPGMSFMGKKTWAPGKSLQTFLAATLDMSVRQQAQIVEHMGDAMSDVAPALRAAMRAIPAFSEIGARMLGVWRDALVQLRDKRSYALGPWAPTAAWDDLPTISKTKPPKERVGPSDLLGKR